MDKTAFSADGYIVDQRGAAGAPYGGCMSDGNGCGWIAAYNVLHAVGAGVSADTVRAALAQGLHFGGRLGTGPLRLVRYLRAQGVRVQWTVLRGAARRNVGACRAGFVLYWTGSSAHFAAFVPARAEDLACAAKVGDVASGTTVDATVDVTADAAAGATVDATVGATVGATEDVTVGATAGATVGATVDATVGATMGITAACAPTPPAPHTPDAQLRFFNATYGDAHHCTALREFLARHCCAGLAAVATVPQE